MGGGARGDREADPEAVAAARQEMVAPRDEERQTGNVGR